MFLSCKRAIWSAVAAIIFVFYCFNFVPRNINIFATRSLTVQIMDYILNFLLFFAIAYLAVTLITYIIRLLFGIRNNKVSLFSPKK